MTPLHTKTFKEAVHYLTEKYCFSETIGNADDAFDALIATAFLAGEKSGKNKAVNYVKNYSSYREPSVPAFDDREATYEINASELDKARTS